MYVLPRRAAVHAAEQLPHDVHVVVLARSDLPAQLSKTGGSTEAEAPAEAEPNPLYRHGRAAKAGVRHAASASLFSARASSLPWSVKIAVLGERNLCLCWSAGLPLEPRN